MTGKVWSTFYPRCYNGFNCRCGKLVMRKWRGLRKRGRAWQNAERARRARLTPAEIDFLAQATIARAVKSGVIALDRKAVPFTSLMRKAFNL